MKQPDRRYPLSVDIRGEDPPLTAAEIEPGRHACDAVVVMPIIYTEGAPEMRVLVVTRDGRTGDRMTDAELFRCWTMLSQRLASAPSLDAAKRELARASYDVAQRVILGGSTQRNIEPKGVRKP